jgi:hypothetical protein
VLTPAQARPYLESGRECSGCSSPCQVRRREPAFLSGLKLLPAEADAYLAGHTTSIREVENLTGLDLLPNLNADDLKKAVASELWPRN